jgi:ubiquinone/menaquinone biosynthesis C-methylase UbiE
MLAPAELAECNRRLQARATVHRDGTPAQEPLTIALGTPGRNEIYRIEKSIVWLLPDLALVDAGVVRAHVMTAERTVVQAFYDNFGWLKADEGQFNDTTRFTDTRPIAREYQRHCNVRIGRELPGGRFLLDVASGAIPADEYLEFSRHYEVRICVDFSVRALREARRKLGDAGLYLLGDITRLPLAPDAVDAVISLHTIYHVPRIEQTAAIDELARVTRCGGRVVVVYVWKSSAIMDLVFGLRRYLGLIRRAFHRRVLPAEKVPPAPAAIPPLYFSPQNYDWFAQEIAPKHRVRLRVWSAVSMIFQRRFFSDHGIGRLAPVLVEWLETTFPRFAGRYGQYPMFIIDKPLSNPGGK